MNEDIRDKEIRLIDADGAMVGVVLTIDAQKMAIAKNLDLVKIVPNAVPPVCKIIDYGKSVFEQAKKEKETKKNQKVVALKEVRLSATIEEHDLEFKVKSAFKFLQDGDKVKASIRFKGREMKYTVAGQEILARFAEAVKEVGIVDRLPRLEGKSMMMIMSPKKQ
jgi:translation initiation factor IF-3